MTSPNKTASHDAPAPLETERPAFALPGQRGRLVLMIALALIALALSLRPTNDETATVVAVAPSASPVAQASGVSGDSQPPLDQAVMTAVAEPVTAGQVLLVETMSTADAPPAAELATATVVFAQDTTSANQAEAGLFANVPGLQDDFTTVSGEWVPMAGSWDVVDGAYVQGDSQGFDYITQLTTDVPESFSVGVRMEALGAELGGGIILGQPGLGSRNGAYVVDFAAGGSFLRWGRYAPDSGTYTYIGGFNVGADPASPQNLRIASRSETTMVYLNDVYIGAFDPVGAGTVGLVTSQSSVAFDDFVLEEA